MERMILDPVSKLPKPWNGFGVRDLGVRVWGGGSSGRKRVGVVRSKLMREREKKRERFKCCGGQNS